MNFREIEGAYVILYERGVFKSVSVFERDSELFAKAKGGYIRLHDQKTTSHAMCRWEEIDGIEYKVKKHSSHLVKV